VIGTAGSLFCWIKNCWNVNRDSGNSGWLACDDGSGELADFIHLDEHQGTLSLIHIKGASTSSPTRGISVGAYEVVVSQAIKNLRHLDRFYLAEGLRLGLERNIGRLVWYNGQITRRTAMLDALERVGASHRRQIVILQPHTRPDTLESIRRTPSHPQQLRLRQLDTLLLGTEASCRNLGATFTVIGDGTVFVH
jgi:hypothetical protein